MNGLIASLILCLTTSPVADRLEPKSLASFDGKSWSGLTLGALTDGDIKKQFQTEKGAIRPEALKLVTTKDSGVRVDALLDGRGDKAVMRAIRVEYDVPPTISSLTADLGEEPVPMYTRDRNEDWRVLAFVTKGVLAIDLGGRVDSFILCAPDQVGIALRDFGDRQSPVTEVQDPGRGWDRIIRFADTDSSVTIGSNKPSWMDSDWRRRIGRRLENEAESIRESYLRYGSSGAGEVSIRVSTERFSDGGEANFTVALSLTANTPYGRFTQSSSRSKKFRDNYERRIMDLFDDAVDELGSNVRYAVQKLGPPPRDLARKTALERVLEGASRKPNG